MEVVPELRYARTDDGVTIAYQRFGQGPPVIWLPSLSNLVAQWRVPVLRRAYLALAGSMTVLLYDGRGTGSSERRAGLDDLGVGAHVRDVTAVLDHAGVETSALFGYYHSVATAIAFAADHASRVSRMVLFGGAARMRDAMNPAQTQALLSLVEQDWDLFADAAAQSWLGWGSGETGRLVAESFRTAATPAVAGRWFRAAQAIDVTDLLPRAVAPTLVLHRQGERQIPVEVSRRLADALPNGRLLELDGTTPTLFFEDASRDLDLVVQFLTTGTVPAARTARGHGITARELEVLRLLASGDSNAEIARRLGISVHTVERHAASLYRKIGARGRTDATAYALRQGLA